MEHIPTSSVLAKEKVNNSIFITGLTRSGTTILGNLIHSFKNVEYSFEPETVFSLLSVYDSLSYSSMKQWMLLYETYLYEDFFLNAVSGRRINCNNSDDSSIYKVKEVSEIDRRLNSSNRKIDVESVCYNRILAYKVPDAMFMIDQLHAAYPNKKIVIIERKPIEVVNSILEKGWFSDRMLRENCSVPCYSQDEFHLPYWLGEEELDLWINYNEIERIIYYVNKMMCCYKNSSKIIKVSYNEMLNNPHKVANSLANELNLSFGPLTKRVIDSIKPMPTTSSSYRALNDVRNNSLLRVFFELDNNFPDLD